MGAHVVYLMPYVVVSYYERYAAPLLGVKVLLVIRGVDRVISVCHKRGPVGDGFGVARRPVAAAGRARTAPAVPSQAPVA